MSTEKTGYFDMWISKIIIVVLIGICLVLSKCVLDSSKNCTSLVSETTTHIVKCDKCYSPPATGATEEESDTSFDCNSKSPCSDKIVQKKVDLYPAFCIVFFVILAVTIAALLILFAKDENCIKCVKLDDLREIRDRVLSENFNDSANKDEKKENHSDDSKGSKTISIVETTDNRVKLLKQYMSCVTDI